MKNGLIILYLNEETIHRILDKSVETVPDTMIMSYPTAKLKGDVFFWENRENNA